MGGRAEDVERDYKLEVTWIQEEWGLRILGVDIDDTFGMQQLIIQEVAMKYDEMFPADKPWLHKYHLPRWVNFR